MLCTAAIAAGATAFFRELRRPDMQMFETAAIFVAAIVAQVLVVATVVVA